MRYETGVCTWTFGDLSLKEIFQRVSALGFDGVELHGDLQSFTPAYVRSLMDEHNLKVFSLTPDNVDIVHSDSVIRNKAMDYYRQLIDFAAELGNPVVSCHGDVGRVKALTSQEQEEALLVENVQILADYAADRNIRLVFEVLNRYESHLINRAGQAKALLKAVGRQNLGVLLDAYHMNIEEPSLAKAIKTTDNQLGLFHIADSNREGIGYGHTDFKAVFAALDDIGYRGPVIMETTARGPNPFTPVKGNAYLQQLEQFLQASLGYIRTLSPLSIH
ncbi:sugar phosphate isomerase/epimerase family protein [Spongorhabdus nitratireducens]